MNVIKKSATKCNSIMRFKNTLVHHNQFLFSFKTNSFTNNVTKYTYNTVHNKEYDNKFCIFKLSYRKYFGKSKKEEPEDKKIINENEQNDKSDKNDKTTDQKDTKDTKTKDTDTVSLEKYNHINNLLKDSEENLSKARTKFDDLRKMYLELQHDYDRLKKRSEQEVSNAKDFAITKFAKDLLEVTDNFQRALNYLEELKTDNKNNEKENENKTQEEKLQIKLDLYNDFSEGVLITKDNLVKTLKIHGVTEYSPINEKFDPNIHEALVNVPSTDKNTPGTVAHVIQTGYKIGTRVLRPAKVAVYKK